MEQAHLGHPFPTKHQRVSIVMGRCENGKFKTRETKPFSFATIVPLLLEMSIPWVCTGIDLTFHISIHVLHSPKSTNTSIILCVQRQRKYIDILLIIVISYGTTPSKPHHYNGHVLTALRRLFSFLVLTEPSLDKSFGLRARRVVAWVANDAGVFKLPLESAPNIASGASRGLSTISWMVNAASPTAAIITIILPRLAKFKPIAAWPAKGKKNSIAEMMVMMRFFFSSAAAFSPISFTVRL